MSELYHHGILGQKWGVRRYQNPDGSLTTEGKRRYEKATDEQWESTGRGRNLEDPNTYYNQLEKKIQKYNYASDTGSKWHKVISSVYDRDYSDYHGKYKTEWQKAKNNLADLNDAEHKMFEQAKTSVDRSKLYNNKIANYLSKKGIIGDERYRKKVREAERKLVDSSDFQTLARKISENERIMDNLSQKMKGIWRDQTLKEILKTVPEKDKPLVYEYYRFFNYNYD